MKWIMQLIALQDAFTVCLVGFVLYVPKRTQEELMNLLKVGLRYIEVRSTDKFYKCYAPESMFDFSFGSFWIFKNVE